MANLPGFVGVPKRASCNRCSNPIFLAERISFGAKSYHRSCLKCARCGTQLTVGSFYETETDGEYCCETCPDEEIQLAQRRESSASSESSRSSNTGAPPVVPIAVGLSRNVRSSKLFDRISFFESAPLSDEEKTSNIERKSRMSSFLKQTLENAEQKQDKPPDLPTTAPPKINDHVQVDKRSDTSDNPEIVDETEDVEDEFEKLVQDLDADDVTLSLEHLPNEIVKPIAISSSSDMQIPPAVLLSTEDDIELTKPDETTSLSSVEKDPTEAINTTAIAHIADTMENTSTHEETKPVVGYVTEVANLTAEKLDDEVVIVVPPANAISPDVVKNDVQSTEEILDDGNHPPTSETIPIENESIVPEEKESTDTKLLVCEPVASNETKLLTDEQAAESTDTELLPNEPLASTETKLSDEILDENAKLKLLPNNGPLVESKETDEKVPETGENVQPLESEPEKPIVQDEHEEMPQPRKKSIVEETQPTIQISTTDEEQYPSDLNPFGNDEDGNGEGHETVVALGKTPAAKPVPTMRRVSTNPFGSEDEDDETPQSPSSKPPRPPPPKVKPSAPAPANPFGEDDEDDAPTEEPDIVPIVSKPSPRRTPVPTPRKAHGYNDSVSSLDNSLLSSSRLSSSNVSLASSLESGGPSSMIVPRRKKGKAPDVPVPLGGGASPLPALPPTSVAEKSSHESLSNSSGSGTLTTPRKKRLAPAPPPTLTCSPIPKQLPTTVLAASTDSTTGLTRAPSQRLLALDASLSGNDHDPADPVSRAPSNESVVYRRTIVPLVMDEDGPESPMHGSTNPNITSERQWEKMKDNKEAQNRNRQSQSSPISEDNGSGYGGLSSILANKSSQGKWKRRKGPAPALPIIAAPMPERKPIKMLPLKEIHQELQIIETQQQGLEKQGIVLEKMIRERCEGVEADVDLDIRLQTNSKEVEDLIMQLFELVNEKNELFRRQAELMYLRRMHRLEQEQADLEYEIRLLMAQPERNKTDSDKEKEEALIARLVEIVQLRNEVVECLEMDRIREAEEDLSIKQSIEERAASQHSKHGSSRKDSSAHSATLPLTDAEKRDSSTKLSKKEKKKLKEAKKLSKSKKIDSEKDADETESSTSKEKKKKRKFLF